jgi:hypothetical protein
MGAAAREMAELDQLPQDLKADVVAAASRVSTSGHEH